MTAPTRADAVQAVAEAILARGIASCEFHGGDWVEDCSYCDGVQWAAACDAVAALAALGPYIAGLIAADREATAEAIEAAASDASYHGTVEQMETLLDAARIVRERTT